MEDYDKINKWTPILDDLKNGIEGTSFPDLPNRYEPVMATKKWKPILDSLNITNNEKRVKIALYAEQHMKLDSYNHNPTNIANNIGASLLPISLKILSKLDNFEIVDNPRLVETYQVSSSINREEIESLRCFTTSPGIEIVQRLESVLVEELISQLRGKRVLVYMVVSSMLVISEETFSPKMILSSRIKILD